MNAERIREVLNQRPSEPFDVIMSSGERHVVKPPEFLMLLPSTVVVGDPVPDRLAILSLVHVTELRPIHSQPSA